MALGTTKSYIDNEEHEEDLSFNHQQKYESNEEETERVRRKVIKVKRMMIQRNIRLLLLPQIPTLET